MFNRIKRLSEKAFEKTLIPPMRFLDKNEESSGVNLKNYVHEIIIKERLKTTIQDIDIHYIYHSPDERYEHILFYYGIKEQYMIIVIDLKSKKILGYHILDLIKKYKLGNNN